jgi:hypothetical protein
MYLLVMDSVLRTPTRELMNHSQRKDGKNIFQASENLLGGSLRCSRCRVKTC